MQRMILVPADQYDRMLASYDEAMEELREIRQQLEAVKQKNVKEGDRPVGKD